MQARASGWLAVAWLREKKADDDLDMIMGTVVEGQTAVRDLFNSRHEGNNIHQPDTVLGGTDDILEYGGREQDGYTTIEFKRRLVTGDTYDVVLHSGINYLAWGFSDSDDPAAAHSHAARGYGQIELK